MLFLGYSEHSVDPKQRLAVPAKYRNQWSLDRDGAAWVCIPWPTGHLRLYTEKEFARLADRGGGESTLATDAVTAEWEANMFSLAERIEPDSAGRLTLPKKHLEYAGLGGVGSEVAVVGARNRLEVHDLTRWKESEKQRFESLPKLVEKMQGRTDGPR